MSHKISSHSQSPPPRGLALLRLKGRLGFFHTSVELELRGRGTKALCGLCAWAGATGRETELARRAPSVNKSKHTSDRRKAEIARQAPGSPQATTASARGNRATTASATQQLRERAWPGGWTTNQSVSPGSQAPVPIRRKTKVTCSPANLACFEYILALR